MDIDLIKGIISLVGATIPLIILIVAFLINRTSRKTELIDSPSLKIILIKRNPVTDKVWKKINRSHLLWAISIILYLTILAIITLLNSKPFSSISYIFSTVLVVDVLLLQTLRNMWPKNASIGRYFVFQEAEIVIEANYYYLLNKCLETFKSLRFNVLEVNEGAGILEANKSIGWFVTLKSRVQIEPIKNSQSSYMIKLEFENLGDETSAKLSPRQRSKIINRFINLLISKPKEANQRTASKEEVSTYTGD